MSVNTSHSALASENLELKMEGGTIVVLCKLDTPRFYNDNRVLVKKLLSHVIEASVLKR